MKGQTKTRKVDMIIVHCSDTYKTMDIGSQEIKKWHVEERGWSGIGYHFIIRRDGTIELGRDLDEDGDIFEEIGAHTYGYNKKSIGICMVGGKAEDGTAENNFTETQFEALKTLIKVVRADYPILTVHGHNEFANKDCPSFDVQEWLREQFS